MVETKTIAALAVLALVLGLLFFRPFVSSPAASTAEIASTPSACGAGTLLSQVTEDATGNLAFVCTTNDPASSPAACTAGNFLTRVTEATDGSLTFTCVADAAEAASSPSACAAGQKLTQVTESAAGVVTLVCALSVNAFFVSNTSTCTHSSATANLGAFTTSPTYTTQGATYLHTIVITLNWKLTAPTTVTVNTQWTFAWGTGTAPTCAASNAGTSVGNTYQFLNPVTATTGAQTDYSETVTITGLSATTTYWFDLKVTDSTADSWIYSLPQISGFEY